MTDDLGIIIKEKTNYFKKKIIQQMGQKKQDRTSSFSKDKTLKHSKSVENIDFLRNPPKQSK